MDIKNELTAQFSCIGGIFMTTDTVLMNNRIYWK